MQVSSIVFSAALLLSGFQGGAAEDPGVLRGCLVTLIHNGDVDVPADLPAQQGGVLNELDISEGDKVTKGQVLGRIDDVMERKLEEVAKYRVDVAKKEASNDISVRYAEAAHMVSEYEYMQALEANRLVPRTIADVEVQRLALQERQFELQIEQSQHELAIAAISVKVREAEFEVATQDVQRREIKAPVDGVVVEVYPDAGEWVRAGDPVLRVVRMDRLQIEGYLDAAWISPSDVDGKPVTVAVRLANGQVENFEGQIDFVNPIIEAGPRFKVRAQVINKEVNGHWRLLPGMNADMTIHWK